MAEGHLLPFATFTPDTVGYRNLHPFLFWFEWTASMPYQSSMIK